MPDESTVFLFLSLNKMLKLGQTRRTNGLLILVQGVTGLFYSNLQLLSGGVGGEVLHKAVGLSTNSITKSHGCFNSIYMMSVADGGLHGSGLPHLV